MSAACAAARIGLFSGHSNFSPPGNTLTWNIDAEIGLANGLAALAVEPADNRIPLIQVAPHRIGREFENA